MGDELRQLKGALRLQARQLRNALPPDWRAQASAAIRESVLNLPEVLSPAASNIALFASFGCEIDTHPLIERLIEIKGAVLLPRVLTDARRLEFRRVNDPRQGFLPAYQGIPEPDPQFYPDVVGPQTMDLIIVPGLLFDRWGFRLGYGGGFYDKLLSRSRRGRAVGIVFSPLLREDPLPVGPGDRAVDALLTEAGPVALRPR